MREEVREQIEWSQKNFFERQKRREKIRNFKLNLKRKSDSRRLKKKAESGLKSGV